MDSPCVIGSGPSKSCEHVGTRGRCGVLGKCHLIRNCTDNACVEIGECVESKKSMPLQRPAGTIQLKDTLSARPQEHRCATRDAAFGCTVCNPTTYPDKQVRKDSTIDLQRASFMGVYERNKAIGLYPVARSLLPTDKQARKDTPICTGVLDYFPLAMAEIARVSRAGNDQHNPGQPLHWAREKSTDHADCITRHLLERGTVDNDGQRHSAKLAWRSLALLEIELEEAGE